MENINTLNIKLDENEKKMLDKINEIYNLLKNENKDINKIINEIKELTGNDDKTLYLKSLLYPEKYKGVKIPNKVPLPTCTFQLHTSKLIRCYTNYPLRIVFNPFFLYDKSYCQDKFTIPDYHYQKYGKYVYVDDQIPKYKDTFSYDYLTSFYMIHGPEQYFQPSNSDQGITNLYSQYRLVSACIMLKYVGESDKISGILGGTILTDDCKYINGNIYVMNNLGYPIQSSILEEYDKYLDYKNYVNNFYHKEVNCIDGIKLIYFPLDNTFEEFREIIKPTNVIDVKVDNNGNNLQARKISALKLDKNFKNNFKFYIYGLGLPDWGLGKTYFKLDIYCNYECLPNPEFNEYLPLNIYNSNLNIHDKQNIMNIIRNKCIMKINDYENILDWKQILFNLEKKKIKINYMDLNDNIEKLENEINEIKENQKKKEEELKKKQEEILKEKKEIDEFKENENNLNKEIDLDEEKEKKEEELKKEKEKEELKKEKEEIKENENERINNFINAYDKDIELQNKILLDEEKEKEIEKNKKEGEEKSDKYMELEETNIDINK